MTTNTTHRRRLTNAQRASVRDTLVRNLREMGLSDEAAVAAVTNGHPSMYEQVARRIARTPEYDETSEVTLELLKRAFAEYVAYKAGYRAEAEETAED